MDGDRMQPRDLHVWPSNSPKQSNARCLFPVRIFSFAPQTATTYSIALIITMKMGKNKRRRQLEQQSGRPVLVTFHVARPSATASAHRHSHGCGHESQRGGWRQKVEGRSHNRNRRAELLEYSTQLRALARQTPPPPPHRPPRRHDDTTKVRCASRSKFLSS